jgi:hypothetical protein
MVSMHPQSDLCSGLCALPVRCGAKKSDVHKHAQNGHNKSAMTETGVIPGDEGLGDLEGKSFEELYEYYRAMYQKVTQDELEKWEKKYPGSEEEKEDLINFYNKHDGNMKAVTEFIPFCETEDLYRVKQVVDKLIADGKLEVSAFCQMPIAVLPIDRLIACEHGKTFGVCLSKANGCFHVVCRQTVEVLWPLSSLFCQHCDERDQYAHTHTHSVHTYMHTNRATSHACSPSQTCGTNRRINTCMRI